MNNKWERIEALMKAKSIRAQNVKIVICDGSHNHDLYVKLGWAERRWVWIDITVSRFTEIHGKSETTDEVDARRKLLETNKRLIEIICFHATELLQSGERTLQDIVKSWKGTHSHPEGVCESIRTKDNEGRVTSPLDAAAKLIEKRIDQWEEEMRRQERMDEGYLEGLVVECLAKLEESPEIFTSWEREFLETIGDKHDRAHLSDKEIDSLEKIHDERNCG